MSIAETKIKECFEDLIKIDGQCGETAPTSGIFLKKLGVTRSELSQYLTKEYATADELFKDKFDTAIINICNSVHSYFAPRYKAFTILENRRAGIFQNNLELIAGTAGRMKGIAFQINNRDSFVDLQLPSFSLQVDHEGDISLQVIDLIQAKLLNTIKIPALPNEIITMAANQVIPSDRKFLNAFIGYDSTGIAANKTLLQLPGGALCCGTSEINNSYLNIRSVSIGVSEQKIDSNLKLESDTGGISLLYSLSCNHRDWICSISQRLALPIAYKTCAELMEHAKYQAGKSQFNIRTASGEVKDEIEERRSLYDRKGEKLLQQVLQNVTLPNDAKCFTCKQINRTATYIP